MKMSIKEFLSKLSGISTPIGGITWAPTKNERQIVYKLFQKLGDRRLTRHCRRGFEYRAGIDSLMTMRKDVTSTLSELSPECKCRKILENIRKALHLFQTFVENEYPKNKYNYDSEHAEAMVADDVLTALSSMQRIVSKNLIELSKIYNIELDDFLKYNFNFEN